jgi:molybdopterin converting factor small subunit
MGRTPPKEGSLIYYMYHLQAALGYALDTWGNVEGYLSSVFCAATNKQHQEVASAAFSAVHSFEVQLDMTNASVLQAFENDTAIKEAWKPIYKEADKLRVMRNRLAHGKIIFVSGGKGSGDVRYLAFFHYATHKDRKDFQHFSQEDVEEVASKFSALGKTIKQFGKLIGAKDQLRQQDWSLK